MKSVSRILLVLILAFSLMLFGCESTGGAGDNSASETIDEAAETDDAGEAGEDSGEEDEEGEEDEAEEPSDGQEDSSSGDETEDASEGGASIYVANDDATGFVKVPVSVSPDDPKALAAELLSNEAIPAGSELLSATQDGSNITIDMNQAFQDGINVQGSTGEYFMIGSLVNTFLDAYGADGVRITIEGNPFETPHGGELNGYLGYYE